MKNKKLRAAGENDYIPISVRSTVLFSWDMRQLIHEFIDGNSALFIESVVFWEFPLKYTLVHIFPQKTCTYFLYWCYFQQIKLFEEKNRWSRAFEIVRPLITPLDFRLISLSFYTAQWIEHEKFFSPLVISLWYNLFGLVSGIF